MVTGKTEVVAMGDVNLDIIAHYPGFLTYSQDALANSMQVHCGGSAANTAAALCGLGLRVRLIGRVGQDPMARLALRCLRDAGVLLGGVQRDPTHVTGLIYIVVTPDGERTMLSYRGANVFTDPEQIREADFRRARLFHISGYALLAEPQRSAAHRALGLAREHRLAICLDPGLSLCQAAPDLIYSLLPSLDLLVPTMAEAEALTGHASPEDCAQALLARGARAAAIKLGKDGCLMAAGEGMVHMPAFAVEAKDTTGAGDAFNAGLIAGYVAGLGWPAAAALGNALGAVTAGRVGAADRAPALAEVDVLLAGHLDDPAFATHRPAIEVALSFLAGSIGDQR
jgi:ribokinase